MSQKYKKIENSIVSELKSSLEKSAEISELTLSSCRNTKIDPNTLLSYQYLATELAQLREQFKSLEEENRIIDTELAPKIIERSQKLLKMVETMQEGETEI